MLADRVPPHSLEAEQAYLGAVMQNADLVVGEVTPEWFYRTGHQLIYSGILRLLAKGQTPDTVMLVNLLRSQDRLEKAGGAAYLSALATQVATHEAADHYAEVILEHYQRRRAIWAATEIVYSAYDQGSSDELGKMFHSGFTAVERRVDRNRHFSSAVDQAIEFIERERSMPNGSHVPTGFTDLDKCSPLMAGDLTIMAGRPGMGKTAFALCVALSAARSDFSVQFFSTEMGAIPLGIRALSGESGIAGNSLRRGLVTSEQAQKLTTASQALATARLWVDDSPAVDSGHIAAQSKFRAQKDGLDLIVVDHLHRMKEKGSFRDPRAMFDHAVIGMKNLARDLETPVLLLCQLNRGVESRSPPIPRMSDLRETGKIEEEADAVWLLYRPEYYLKDKTPPEDHGVGHLFVEKNRHGETAVVKLRFDAVTVKYQSLHW